MDYISAIKAVIEGKEIWMTDEDNTDWQLAVGKDYGLEEKEIGVILDIGEDEDGMYDATTDQVLSDKWEERDTNKE